MGLWRWGGHGGAPKAPLGQEAPRASSTTQPPGERMCQKTGLAELRATSPQVL